MQASRDVSTFLPSDMHSPACSRTVRHALSAALHKAKHVVERCHRIRNTEMPLPILCGQDSWVLLSLLWTRAADTSGSVSSHLRI